MAGRRTAGGKAAGKKSELAERAASIERCEDSSSLSPLDYMLSVMRDPAVEPARRDEMAKLALPYLHPKPSAMEQGGKDDGGVELPEISEMEVARRIGFMLARATLAEKQ